MPTRLTGQIEHITCTNEESGFTIAKESQTVRARQPAGVSVQPSRVSRFSNPRRPKD